MFEDYSADEIARLFVAGLEANNEELIVVALQAARAASVEARPVSAAIVERYEPFRRFRIEATAAIGRYGRMDLLLGLLDANTWRIRAHVAQALGEVGGPIAREALTKLAADPAEWVQIRARLALEGLPTRYQSQKLDEPAARSQAIAALILGEPSHVDLEQLPDLIEHPAEKVRGLAKEAIAKRGAEARDRLFGALSRPDRVVTEHMISLLGELRDRRGVPFLLRGAALGEPKISKASIATLSALDGLDEPAVVASVIDLFVAAVEGDARFEPRSLRSVLGTIGPAAGPHLVRAYSERPAVRRAEGELIGRIAGASALPVLLTAFQDVDSTVRASAAKGLIAVGQAAVPALLDLFYSPSNLRERQRDVVRVIAECADARAIPLLLESLQSDYRVLRQCAADGMVKLGSVAVPRLVDLLQSPVPPPTCLISIDALGRIGDPDALAALEAIIDAPATTPTQLLLHDAAVRALGGFRDDRAVQILRRLLRDRREEKYSMRALADLVQNRRVQGPLFDDMTPYPATLLSLLSDLLIVSSAEVRRRAFHLLRHVWRTAGTPSELVIETLRPVFADEESDLVDAAIRHLAEHPDEHRRHISRALSSAAGVLKVRLERALDAIDAASRQTKQGRYAYSLDHGPLSAPVLQPPHRLPFPIGDAVHFSVSAPLSSVPGERFVLGIWVHHGRDDIRELAISQQRGQKTHIDSRGPVPVPTNVELVVHVQIPDYDVDGLTDTVYWSGMVGNCSFPLVVPPTAAPGLHFGRASFRIGDLIVSTLDFALQVATATEAVDDVSCHEARCRRCFASYTSEDRQRVLGRIQGMLKVLPELDIFMDVLSLRSGEKWAERVTEEIVSRDTFFLFWSLAASKSKWVEHEWRTALEQKGLGAISPVPLDPPAQAPPPPELASLHFADLALAFEHFG